MLKLPFWYRVICFYPWKFIFHAIFRNFFALQVLMMVSRRKILSKSRDDINVLSNGQPDDSEDVWYQKEKLFKVGTIVKKIYLTRSGLESLNCFCELHCNNSLVFACHRSDKIVFFRQSVNSAFWLIPRLFSKNMVTARRFSDIKLVLSHF